MGADRAWSLDNYAETQFGEDRVTVRREARATEPNSLPPDMVGLTVVREESLDAVSLFRYVRFREQSGLNASSYAVAFWQRISASAATASPCT